MPKKDRIRILTVDDEPVITHYLTMVLERAGCEVKGENDPLKALSSARDFNPDLVLLDMNMPELNGTEVAMQIANDAKLKNTPVIFLTGQTGLSLDGPCKSIPILQKPVGGDYLIAFIHRILT